jgi:hypothetical protein
MTTADTIAQRILDQAVEAGELEREPDREGITEIKHLTVGELAFVISRIPTPEQVAAERDAIFEAIPEGMAQLVGAELRRQAQAHFEHAAELERYEPGDTAA